MQAASRQIQNALEKAGVEFIAGDIGRVKLLQRGRNRPVEQLRGRTILQDSPLHHPVFFGPVKDLDLGVEVFYYRNQMQHRQFDVNSGSSKLTHEDDAWRFRLRALRDFRAVGLYLSPCGTFAQLELSWRKHLNGRFERPLS